MMDNIYIYEILGESWGIVIASSKEEAEQKVRESYKKHDSDYDEYRPVYIMNKKEYEANNNWFKDSPDVLEVFG